MDIDELSLLNNKVFVLWKWEKMLSNDTSDSDKNSEPEINSDP